MTALALPDLRLHESWAAALAEHRPEGDHVSGAGLWNLPEDQRWDLSEAGCARLVARLTELGTESPDEPERVASDYWWITDGEPDEVVGFLAVRHRLNDWLLNEGGHIGYSVRPSRRREGHATRALLLALDRASELGIDRALITCDDDNAGSRATILGGGGVYEDTRNGKQRYWIDL